MDIKKHIAQVVVDRNVYNLDKLFDYIIPEHLRNEIKIGMRVVLPFGKGNNTIEGYVFNIENKINDNNLKEVIRCIDIDPILSKNQIKMIYWMKKKYLCKYVEAVNSFIPSGTVKKEKRNIKLLESEWRTKGLKLSLKQEKLVRALYEAGGVSSFDALRKCVLFNDANSIIKSLKEKKIIDIEYKFESRVKLKTQKYIELAISGIECDKAALKMKSAPKQKLILEYLCREKSCLVSDVINVLNVSRPSMNSLVDKGFLKYQDYEVKRNPFLNKDVDKYPKIMPSSEQKVAIEKIVEAIKEKKQDVFLIHGITGSGKTEIYLQVIEEVIKGGKQGIVLVPEISLTPQTVERFRGRFGDCIAVLHSSLSEGERYDEWRRIKEGKVSIVIGARSAIFAPLEKLGIIIIDEEHETSYKSEQNPKYNATEIAIFRTKVENAVLVLGSATPSLESFYKASTSSYNLLTLKNRATTLGLPDIEIVDMCDELDIGNDSSISVKLHDMIKENFTAKKQTIIFLNRRGFSTIISCKKCGHVAKCRDCDITMTYHIDINEIKCHYCGDRKKAPNMCSECGSKIINYAGVGTQKLEKILQSILPEAKIARLDVDATRGKGSHQKILDKFKTGEIDILIGTQMISKGLDFPNVTLVGIINIDATLNLPDFRAAEKTFQLITQVAGRAGRGLDEGKVILQTDNSHHYSIETAKEHDYINFFNEEIQIRKEFIYPPFVSMIAINFSGKNKNEVKITTEKIYRAIEYVLIEKGILDLEEVLLGPNEAIIPKISQKYRYNILLKDYNVSISILKGIISYFVIQHRSKYIPKNINVSIDINPNNFM
ncbi:MAG: primosomal protein N' [Alkaliphilus sp.]|nr:MAG: primosomal protein N' [Alkaliphilus sp.]